MSDKAIYTLRDYKEARAGLEAVNQRFADYTGNNPDKYRTAQREARERLREVEKYLKDTSLLPMSDQEKLERDLDRAFPNAERSRS